MKSKILNPNINSSNKQIFLTFNDLMSSLRKETIFQQINQDLKEKMDYVITRHVDEIYFCQIFHTVEKDDVINDFLEIFTINDTNISADYNQIIKIMGRPYMSKEYRNSMSDYLREHVPEYQKTLIKNLIKGEMIEKNKN